MSETSIAVRTEVHDLEIQLDGSQLMLTSAGQSLIAPVMLNSEDSERLRVELSKAQLWEWNELESMRTKAEKRYRYHLVSWLVLCLAAFSAYIGHPGYYLPLALCALSIFIWWTSDYKEQQREKDAQVTRNEFVPEWSYFQQRRQESAPAQE